MMTPEQKKKTMVDSVGKLKDAMLRPKEGPPKPSDSNHWRVNPNSVENKMDEFRKRMPKPDSKPMPRGPIDGGFNWDPGKRRGVPITPTPPKFIPFQDRGIRPLPARPGMPKPEFRPMPLAPGNEKRKYLLKKTQGV